MDMYCSIDDAFSGSIMPPGVKKKKKTKEYMTGSVSGTGAAPGSGSTPVFVPGEPDRFAEKIPMTNDVLESPQSQSKTVVPSTEDTFFPLPGDTASPEAWQKAFMLEPDWTKMHNITDTKYRPDGTTSVDGQPTLWRHIPSYMPQQQQQQQPQTQIQSIPSKFPDIQKRLDDITQQIEALTIPTHLQSTAELFLFVAIGLVLLLAIDILLKYATVMAMRSANVESRVGGFHKVGGFRGFRGRSKL